MRKTAKFIGRGLVVYGTNHNTGKRGAAETIRPIGMNQSAGNATVFSTFPALLLVPITRNRKRRDRKNGRKDSIIFKRFYAPERKNSLFLLRIGKERQMDELGQNNFDIAGFLPDVSKQFCPQCGGAVTQTGRGRPRTFCSPDCSRQWWAAHPKPEHWKSAKWVACRGCGKQFLSAKELYRPRKYCSRACANRARAMRGSEKNDG